MIRLYIIEDHENMVVNSFRHMFRGSHDNINVAGSSCNVDEAVAKADPGTFDLLILDLWLPGAEPVNNIRELKKHFPDKPILIFTSEDDPYWKRTMMMEGAMAYITKDTSTKDLRNAIKKVIAGESVFPGLVHQADKTELGILLEQNEEELTDSQKEILTRLKNGMKHKDISKELLISVSNIDKNLNTLRIRYKVTNNIELVTHLIEMGEI